jgi:hypothetical protein
MSFISEDPEDRSMYKIREFMVTPPPCLPSVLPAPLFRRGEDGRYAGMSKPAVLAVSRMLL